MAADASDSNAAVKSATRTTADLCRHWTQALGATSCLVELSRGGPEQPALDLLPGSRALTIAHDYIGSSDTTRNAAVSGLSKFKCADYVIGDECFNIADLYRDAGWPTAVLGALASPDNEDVSIRILARYEARFDLLSAASTTEIPAGDYWLNSGTRRARSRYLVAFDKLGQLASRCLLNSISSILKASNLQVLKSVLRSRAIFRIISGTLQAEPKIGI